MFFNLDFTIETAKDRADYIRRMVEIYPISGGEIELCSNYILYGKNDSGFSDVDDGKIVINTKFSSYKKKAPLSLETLLENPFFSENDMSFNLKSIYKKQKPTIDRDKDGDITGMKELWEIIDREQHILDWNEGKCELKEGEVLPKLEGKELYEFKHQLIQTRTQQFILKDCERPAITCKMNPKKWFGDISDEHCCFNVLPRGMMVSQDDNEFKHPYLGGHPNEIDDNLVSFDFRVHEHVYQLILHYSEIADMIREIPDSPLWNLLWTLDFYFDKTFPSDQERIIYEMKKFRYSNEEISQVIFEKLGRKHQENYISTIWKQKICNNIIAAAELNFDEWLCRNYDKAWKRCNCCGELLLRDPRNFVKKTKSPDGLTGRCKRCDKMKRDGKLKR